MASIMKKLLTKTTSINISMALLLNKLRYISIQNHLLKVLGKKL